MAKDWRNRKRRVGLKTKVCDAFDSNPWLTSTALGLMLNLHPAYVRKTLRRSGRRLARAR